ncbi:MAG: hypothetical protein IPK52_25575 [Chloroflexi bacterium]|nr:hypothetical protein [Chloroflexota bacterium]
MGNNLSETTLRYIVVAIIWVGMFILAAYMSRRALRREDDTAESLPGADQNEKPKRGDSLAELMALLNDEDIEDLRQRVKSRMIEQIETGTPEEVETFEQLLETPEKPSRKSGSPSNMNV